MPAASRNRKTKTAGRRPPAKPVADAERLNFRLPADQKSVISEAAALSGQTVTDFAVSTLLTAARSVLRDHEVTVLSARDRDAFIRMLDNAEAAPNAALLAAAGRYRKFRS